METIESRIIEALKRRDAKWTGLHVILMRFEPEEQSKAWHKVIELAQSGIIEKKGHIHYHEITKTPAGMLYLYRYLPKMKPQLGVVE